MALRPLLNPAFSPTVRDRIASEYVLPPDVADLVRESNRSFDTGPELRLQPVFGDELWSRLDGLDASGLDWSRASVLDACCGTGLLSYHLLARIRPAQLTLTDISEEEIRRAEHLIACHYEDTPPIRFIRADLANTQCPDASFDIIVGNSFLHHFHDVPRVLSELYRLLRPGGFLIGLHEPTPTAFALESGKIGAILQHLRFGRAWIERVRYRGDGAARDGCEDVWVFEHEDVKELLRRAGFEKWVVQPTYLTRPLLVALLRLQLTREQPQLTRSQQSIMRLAVRCDSALARALPGSWFGAVAFRARRPDKSAPR